MKRKWLQGTVLAISLMFMTGCSQREENPVVTEAEKSQQETETISRKTEETADTEAVDETDKNGQLGDDNLFSSLQTYSFQEITISIPDSWEGKYQIEENQEGFSVIQTASYEKEEGMGFLCGFYRTDGMVIDAPGATPLAYTDTQTYYMAVPTDVSYYYEDEAIAKEYQEMYELVNAVAATLNVEKEGVKYDPDQFILPLSNTIPVKDEDLLNCSDNELSIARNEIYARHGRKFQDEYLANYFESCSWYEGTVSPEEFDETVLSQIEKDNLDTIKRAEEAYREAHPYPKECETGILTEADLDGDGTSEKIQYTLQKADDASSYKGILEIDGRKFDLEDYQVQLITPEQEHFYITDISSYYDGLEIAVLDYGPSADFVTYFFSYNGELNYLGSVDGFPFKQLTGYNGFSNDGCVIGQIRLDFTHTCHAYDYWWYDYDNQKLEYQDTGYYRLVPEGAHELYEDMTVFLDMDETHLKNVLSAGENVFFLETDGKEWVLVRGKDGTEGYMHIVDGKISGLSKEPQEVFSDLTFSD